MALSPCSRCAGGAPAVRFPHPRVGGGGKRWGRAGPTLGRLGGRASRRSPCLPHASRDPPATDRRETESSCLKSSQPVAGGRDCAVDPRGGRVEPPGPDPHAAPESRTAPPGGLDADRTIGTEHPVHGDLSVRTEVLRRRARCHHADPPAAQRGPEPAVAVVRWAGPLAGRRAAIGLRNDAAWRSAETFRAVPSASSRSLCTNIRS